MTNLVVALQAEARPIIETLDLVQDRPAGIFPVYCNDDLSLVCQWNRSNPLCRRGYPSVP